MYVDKELLLSDAQAITNSHLSTSVIDLSVAKDIGKGAPLFAVVVVDTTFVDADASPTLTVTLYSDNDAAMGSPTTMLVTQAYAKAGLTAGRNPIIIPIPPAVSAERYLALYYTVSGGLSYDAGAVTAFITPHPQTND